MERRTTCALDNKPPRFEKYLITFSCIFSIDTKIVSIVFVHYFIIIGATFSCVFCASKNKYPFLHFIKQQTVTISYFSRTFLGLVGEMSSWLIINKRGGVAIRISYYAFFKNYIIRGGRLFRTGE